MLKFKRNNIMKTVLVLLVLMLGLTGCGAAVKTDAELASEGWVLNPAEQGWVENPIDEGYKLQAELPAPTKEGCTENPYSIACSSIGTDNLDEYLNRDDVLYIDLRDYKDYTQKHLKNFEVIPYFAFIFNADAHTDETKVQLYGGSTTEPIPAYEQSSAILNEMFPKDKTLFLICQSGGRVTMLMEILEAEGYDMSKIYNVGGVAQYTDSKYAKHITDTLEFTVDATYTMEGLTRN